MNKSRLIILYFILFIIAGLALLYSIFLYVLPPLLSSNKFKNFIDKSVYNKTGIKISSEYLNVKTYPNLIIKVEADKINLDSDEAELLQAKKVSVDIDIKKFAISKVNLDYVYINDNGFKNITGKDTKKRKTKFNIRKLPEIYVKYAEIWADKGEINSIFITVNDLHQINKNNKTFLAFEMEIISNLLKNIINIGSDGYLYFENDTLYANNLKVLIGISTLDINGLIINKNNKTDLTIKGEGIPVSDIFASLLYFQKIKEPGKKFIENFYNYSGTMDVDLSVNNSGLNGKATAHNLSVNSVLFNVPINFPNIDFNFNGQEINAAENGTLGSEKVYTEVKLTKILTPEQEVTGSVISKLTDNFAEKYIPDLSIKKYAEASVKYKIKQKKIDIDYLLKLPTGSDLHYKSAYLGLEDRNRQLFIHTLKDKDKLYITNYHYSTQNGNKISKIIYGKGSFTKENGHFLPDYITCKTKDYAPVSVAGSFYKYANGGFFNGDLKYDFRRQLLLGNFSIKDSKYKDFIIKSAKINTTENTVTVEANGDYRNSPFECQIIGENKFSKKIKIYNMYLFLDKYIVNRNKKNQSDINDIKNKIHKQAKQLDVEIDKWAIKVNKIIRERLEITNILVTGSIKNNIFNFEVPHIGFAKGILTAKGNYNYNNKSSDIVINLNNIDSSVVADVLFELPEQIQGLANATLKAKTRQGLEQVNAHVDFFIKDGFLPKLGSTEFMIKKSRMIKRPFKIKLSDITNIDLRNMKALSSDVKGSFDFDNEKISNAKITSTQKFLSLLIEGDYNMNTQNADLKIFGKYNKEKLSRVKILFVPLSFILKIILRPEKTMETYQNKLHEVPDINTEPDNISAFRVKLNGNINNNDVKVEMKSIK